MDQHMRTLPPNLQRQMSNGTHMSRQAQKAISDHMQKTMPSHLKQYAGAYVEQSIMSPSMGSSMASPAGPQPHAPLPDRLRLDHSNVSASQYEAKFHADLFAPDQHQPTVVSPQTATVMPSSTAPVAATVSAPPTPPPADVPPAQQGPNYNFIMEPPKPERRSLLPTNSGPAIRIALILGGVLVVFVIFAVIKSLLFSSGGNKQALITVAQDQQAIIHIVTNATTGTQGQQPAVLSASNQSFAITTQLKINSAQTQLLTYLKANHVKASTKVLGLKVDAATDQQLSAAAANSTYDSTFQQVMQAKLNDYQSALDAAYKQTSGPNGRKLIKQEFQGAQLLLTQLNSPAS